jgi:hypothetical protein
VVHEFLKNRNEGLKAPHGVRLILKLDEVVELSKLEEINNDKEKKEKIEIKKKELLRKHYIDAFNVGRFDILQEIVDKEGMDFYSQLSGGASLFYDMCCHEAYRPGNIPGLLDNIICLSRKIDINELSGHGNFRRTPLQMSCGGNSKELVKTLIMCGARIDKESIERARGNFCCEIFRREVYQYLQEASQKQNLNKTC